MKQPTQSTTRTSRIRTAGLLFTLFVTYAMAQQSSLPLQEDARKFLREQEQYPQSPNGLPMEAVFDPAPEATKVRAGTPGPYLISRWGGIVIRGRRDGDTVVTVLYRLQCGSDKNPATEITLIGVPPDDLCDSIEAVPRGKSSTSLSLTGGALFGTHDGWTKIEFAQQIEGNSYGGLSPADDGAFGLSSSGALFRDEEGKHVFFAPGETVQRGSVSFVVKPLMSSSELEELVDRVNAAAFKAVGQNMDKLGQLMGHKPEEHTPPPAWFYVLFFGTPLALIGGATYWIVRRVRRGRSKR